MNLSKFCFLFFHFFIFFLLLIGKFINWLWFPVIFIFSHQVHYPEKNLLFIYFFSSFYTKMAAELKYIGGSTPFYLFLALLSKFDPKYKLFKSIITYMIVWIQWFINKSQLKKENYWIEQTWSSYQKKISSNSLPFLVICGKRGINLIFKCYLKFK